MITKDLAIILGHAIPEDKIEETFNALDRDNRIGKKEMIKILVLLITKEVERERQ